MQYPSNVRNSTRAFHFKQLFHDKNINRLRLQIHYDFDQCPTRLYKMYVCKLMIIMELQTLNIIWKTMFLDSDYVNTMCTSLLLSPKTIKHTEIWLYDHQYRRMERYRYNDNFFFVLYSIIFYLLWIVHLAKIAFHYIGSDVIHDKIPNN